MGIAVVEARKMTPDTLLDQLEKAWTNARGQRAFPRRADIDPAVLRGALPYASLIDVVAGERVDFRYRLLGQRLIEGFGQNITGGLHSEFADKNLASWPLYEAYLRCIATGQPQDIDHEFRNSNKTPVRMRARVWPLSDDGKRVTGLLGGGLFLVAALKV
jgi:hypothetical protein